MKSPDSSVPRRRLRIGLEPDGTNGLGRRRRLVVEMGYVHAVHEPRVAVGRGAVDDRSVPEDGAQDSATVDPEAFLEPVPREQGDDGVLRLRRRGGEDARAAVGKRKRVSSGCEEVRPEAEAEHGKGQNDEKPEGNEHAFSNLKDAKRPFIAAGSSPSACPWRARRSACPVCVSASLADLPRPPREHHTRRP